MNTSNFLLVLGVFVMSQALRSTQNVLLHKLGIFGHVGTSFLLGYLLSGEWWVGVLFASIWFVWPWYELITRVRKIVMPLEKTIRHKSPPNRDFFPALDELTNEIEAEGFEHFQDLGGDWEEVQQFFRVFYNGTDRIQAMVCLVEQERFAFYYIRLSSTDDQGRVWITWNYPFSLNLKMATGWRLNRERGDRTFIQLLDSHRAFLERNNIVTEAIVPANPDTLIDEIQKEQEARIARNLTAGILAKQADGAIRYTWRGLLFIWVQFLRDFVRLS